MPAKNRPIPKKIQQCFSVFRRVPVRRQIGPKSTKRSLEEKGKIQIAIYEKLGVAEEISKLTSIQRAERDKALKIKKTTKKRRG